MEPRGVRLRGGLRPRAGPARHARRAAGLGEGPPGPLHLSRAAGLHGIGVRAPGRGGEGEEAGFAYLKALKPFTYRGGEVLPKSEAELNDLFANGEVDVAMSYDSSFVPSAVRKGQFPDTTRPFLLGGGALTNTSYVTIPADAAHRAGAQVGLGLTRERLWRLPGEEERRLSAGS